MPATIDRRAVIAGVGSAAGLLAAGCETIRQPASPPTTYFAYVGSRTTRARNARGNGVNVYQVDASTGAWTHRQTLAVGENPSFLAIDRSKTFLYTVHGDGSDVSAMRIGEDGRLSLINRKSAMGKNPAHLAIDPSNKWVIVANHYSSTVAVLPRNEDGSLGDLVDLVTLTGTPGPWRDEQPYAKPHQIVFDPSGRMIAVPDKGLDRVFCFRLDTQSGKLSPAEAPPMKARRASGPRHMAFHPTRPCAYVLNELSSTITTAKVDVASGGLAPIQLLPTLPDTFTSDSAPSEIEISADARFLYLSNRGHDSIGVFSIDAATGRLAPVGWSSTEGRTPRHFALSPDGRFLFAANEDTDTIVTFAVDRRSGTLTRIGAPLSVGSPVCIVFKI